MLRAKPADLPILLTLILVMSVLIGISFLQKPDLLFFDFIHFYQASKLVEEGHASELYSRAPIMDSLQGRSERLIQLPYPPHAMALWQYLSRAPYEWAAYGWVCLQSILFLLALYAYGRHHSGTFKSSEVLIMLAVSTPFLLIQLIFAQSNLFATSLFLLGLTYWHRTPIAGGICFGLLTFKPQIGISLVAAIAATRPIKLILVAVTVTTILCLISVAQWGIHLWLEYKDYLPFYSSFILDIPHSSHRIGIVSTYMGLYNLGFSTTLAWIGQWISMAMALGSTYWVFRKNNMSQFQREAVLITSTFLASPYIHFYDQSLLAGVLLVMAIQWWRYGSTMLQAAIFTYGMLIMLTWLMLGMSFPFAWLFSVSLWLYYILQSFRREPDGILTQT